MDFDTPEYRADWGLAQINAAPAYARGFTGLGVLVAVYDTGIDRNHPEFSGRISPDSRNFFYASDRKFYPSFIRDEQGHGTHVSGTIAAARDGTGTMGVAYGSTILTLYGLPADGITEGGRVADFTVDYTGALAYAAKEGARVYNGSYGLNFTGMNYPIFQKYIFSYESMLAEYNAMKRAVDGGTLFVFAAMNNYEAQPVLSRNPASAALLPYIKPSNANSGVYQFYDIYRFIGDPIGHPIDQSAIDFSGVAGSVVAVVATDRDNKIASFSNRCGVTASWCIAAPGVGILSTTPTDMGQPYNYMSGTSMATPHVSGAAAVLMQAFPFLTVPQIAQTMFTTATHLGDGPADTPNDIYGWGLLNLGKAIDGPGQFTSTWTVNTTYKGQAYDGRFANDISGSGGLIKIGLGTLELAGTNTYAGGTSVYGGSLAVSRDANLGASGTGLVLGGGTLRILADGFSTPRPITLDGAGALRIEGGTATFAGTITDGAQAGSLVKTGAGAAILSAANSFTGRTIVADGALGLTSTGRLASPVFVGQGARFTNAGFASGGVGNLGTLVNSGTIAGGVINAGLLTSRGTITGDVVSSGILMTSGTIAGQFVNAGSAQNTGTIAGSVWNAPHAALYNRGGIAGAVTNAGLLLNTGTISGAATNSGLLTTNGTIAGGLINSGTIQNGGVIAGGAGNTGSLVSSGTIAGGVTNTGFLGNTGTVTGAVSNAGTGLLGNAGTLAGGVANAGTLANTGTINGGLSNTGRTQNAGAIAGGVSNTGLVQNTGAIAGGVSNSGTLATTGAIAGDVTNAGLWLSSGTIAGTVANAGFLGNTGTVTGAVSNARTGLLGNAGTLVGGVANAGTLANTGTINGGLSNTGRTQNAGAITGGVSNSGILATSGTISGGLSNAGLVQNTGAIAGGVSNSGTLATSGTIAGGLTNTGTMLASAGRIDGAIANKAGTVTVAGAVASDGTFANAAGATLAVSGTGAYSLAGPLT
ncbi:Subtilase family protein, partial [Methylobacterium phyllostachyos]